MEWKTYEAALFDLDGVLTPTTDIHMRAWSEMFNSYLELRDDGQEPYTDDDYFNYVDGKPRYEGVATFLESRNIHLPQGDPSDPVTAETVCGLGNRKNAEFNRVLERDGIDPYPGSLRLLDALAELGMPLAVVSSSRNAKPVLAAANIADRFQAVVDGVVTRDEGLSGKPAPDAFLHAAKLLGVDPAKSVVLEDAISGAQAGAAGDFGLVVGIDRGAGEEVLKQAGAHIVVADCEELLP